MLKFESVADPESYVLRPGVMFLSFFATGSDPVYSHIAGCILLYAMEQKIIQTEWILDRPYEENLFFEDLLTTLKGNRLFLKEGSQDYLFAKENFYHLKREECPSAVFCLGQDSSNVICFGQDISVSSSADFSAKIYPRQDFQWFAASGEDPVYHSYLEFLQTGRNEFLKPLRKYILSSVLGLAASYRAKVPEWIRGKKFRITELSRTDTQFVISFSFRQNPADRFPELGFDQGKGCLSFSYNNSTRNFYSDSKAESAFCPDSKAENAFCSNDESGCNLYFSSGTDSESAYGSQACFEQTEREGTLFVPYLYGTLYHFLPDYNNYYYLPAEDEVIHKSLGKFIDPHLRRRAKEENCYIKKTGYFLLQPAPLFTPDFRSSYENKNLYFSCTSEFLNDEEQISRYLAMMAEELFLRY